MKKLPATVYCLSMSLQIRVGPCFQYRYFTTGLELSNSAETLHTSIKYATPGSTMSLPPHSSTIATAEGNPDNQRTTHALQAPCDLM